MPKLFFQVSLKDITRVLLVAFAAFPASANSRWWHHVDWTSSFEYITFIQENFFIRCFFNFNQVAVFIFYCKLLHYMPSALLFFLFISVVGLLEVCSKLFAVFRQGNRKGWCDKDLPIIECLVIVTIFLLEVTEFDYFFCLALSWPAWLSTGLLLKIGRFIQ